MSKSQYGKQPFGKSYKKGNTDYPTKLLRAWTQAIQLADEFTEKIIDCMFKSLKGAIAGKISASCQNDGGLLSHDEKIYDCYKRLMDQYGEIATRYKERKQKVTTVHISAILDGIYAVVISRLILFNEYTQKSDINTNPIFVEKKEIMSGCIKAFSKNFDAVVVSFIAQKQREFCSISCQHFLNCDDYAETVAMFDGLAQEISSFCFSQLYQYYANVARFAGMTLNDFDARKALSQYVELLLQEKQILTDIASTQAKALESVLPMEDVSDEEKEVVFSVLFALKEANEHFTYEMDSLSIFFKHTAESKKPYALFVEEFVQFKEEMAECIRADEQIDIAVFDEFKMSFGTKISHFYALFKNLIENVFQNTGMLSKNKYRYVHNKILFEQQTMANSMCAVFCTIQQHYEENREKYKECAYADIIAGINETIQIKTDVLAEAIASFEDEMAELSVESIKDTPIDESEIKGKADELAKLLIKKLCAISTGDKNGLNIIKKFISDAFAEITAAFEEKTVRAIQKYEDIVNKKVNRFRKEYLLYEVSTFEEILYYSVSRLRESDDETIRQYVILIDQNTSELDRILLQNGIMLIRPMPHEPFNGKEHEVLMAETNEGFKKGEIIKVMNSGYKSGETVIIRANVIAAK